MKKFIGYAGILSSMLLVGCSGSGSSSERTAASTTDELQLNKQSSTPLTQSIPGYVHGPGGVYTHASCAHQIPSGYLVDADQVVRDKKGNFVQKLPKCDFQPIFTRPGNLTTGAGVGDAQAPSTDGWVSATEQYIPEGATTWVGAFAYITVPQYPNDTAALNYYFNGEETAGFNPIIQPVLQFGPGSPEGDNLSQYWTIAAWRVYSDGTYVYSTPQVAVPGDQVILEMYVDTVNSPTDYIYGVLANDETRGLSTSAFFDMNSSNGGNLFPYLFPAVHESYNDSDCESGAAFTQISQATDIDGYAPPRGAYVAANPTVWSCYTGSNPSCFFCPEISDNGINTSVY